MPRSGSYSFVPNGNRHSGGPLSGHRVLILLAVARSFQESGGGFHFLGVATILTIGSAAIEREIIPVPLKNVTPKDGEDLCGLCLEVHDRFSFILK